MRMKLNEGKNSQNQMNEKIDEIEFNVKMNEIEI